MDEMVVFFAAIKWSKANVRIYSNSVLRLGEMVDHSEASGRWECQVKEFQKSDSYREFGVDGDPIEVEWTIFQDLRHWKFTREY